MTLFVHILFLLPPLLAAAAPEAQPPQRPDYGGRSSADPALEQVLARWGAERAAAERELAARGLDAAALARVAIRLRDGEADREVPEAALAPGGAVLLRVEPLLRDPSCLPRLLRRGLAMGAVGTAKGDVDPAAGLALHLSGDTQTAVRAAFLVRIFDRGEKTAQAVRRAAEGGGDPVLAAAILCEALEAGEGPGGVRKAVEAARRGEPIPVPAAGAEAARLRVEQRLLDAAKGDSDLSFLVTAGRAEAHGEVLGREKAAAQAPPGLEGALKSLILGRAKGTGGDHAGAAEAFGRGAAMGISPWQEELSWLEAVSRFRAGDDARAGEALARFLRLYPDARRRAREKAALLLAEIERRSPPPKTFGAEITEPLREVASRMGEVERDLARGKGGMETEEAIWKIVEELDRLTQGRRSSDSGGSSSANPEQKSDPSERQREKEELQKGERPQSETRQDPALKPEPKEGEGKKEEKKDPEKGGGGEQKKEEPADPLKRPLDPRQAKPAPGGPGGGPAVKTFDPWGFLPPRERQELLQARDKQFPPEFEDLLKRYYLDLSEDE